MYCVFQSTAGIDTIRHTRSRPSQNGKLSGLRDELPGPEDIDRVTDALIECTTADEFIDRVRMG